jgi:hypothetical protein
MTMSAGTDLHVFLRWSDKFLAAAQRSISEGVQLVTQCKYAGLIEVINPARAIRLFGNESRIL